MATIIPLQLMQTNQPVMQFFHLRLYPNVQVFIGLVEYLKSLWLSPTVPESWLQILCRSLRSLSRKTHSRPNITILETIHTSVNDTSEGLGATVLNGVSKPRRQSSPRISVNSKQPPVNIGPIFHESEKDEKKGRTSFLPNFVTLKNAIPVKTPEFKVFSSSAKEILNLQQLPQALSASEDNLRSKEVIEEGESIGSLVGNVSESSRESFNRKEFMEYMTSPKMKLRNQIPQSSILSQRIGLGQGSSSPNVEIGIPTLDKRASKLDTNSTIKRTIGRQPVTKRRDTISGTVDCTIEVKPFVLSFLLPAYDSKGARVALDSFDRTDVAGMSLRLNGFHPKSRFQTIFDLLMIVVHFASLCVVPFLIGFHEMIDPTATSLFDSVITVVYILEAIISLLTPKSEVRSRIYSIREYELMRPYLSEWIKSQTTMLFFDVLSALPLRTMFSSTIGCEFLLLLRLIRIIRLPFIVKRCAYFARLRTHTEKLLGVGGAKIVPIGLTIFVFIHYNACMLYYAGRSNGFVGWETFWFELKTASLWDSYVLAFLLGVGNMFPMSFKPQTVCEQMIDIFFIFIGAGLYAILVGYISSAAISFDNSGRLYNQKMEELIDYIKWKKLSPETRQKLISYYETKYRGKYFEEDTLLADMNESLRTEISLQNTRSLIMKVPFLRRETGDHRDEIFYSRIASALHARYTFR
ncbi:hypothetical protein BCR33DRAFT_766643 [Rhizoclosmatium globosum]|uniref:Ion transport domain-containing protein n=1 Tax=Rhizoclosmatium globosum TaxID=329046 RepID=A0A1Y2C8U8_9FUNG|nr:hypothetical protein BCR33DRAFT_766643 [Rhizoclosmatium globosum]|eukprot:ORY43461.1 hypothetical protein BCR33DRAFT_766643 [Rhizoclosmatium globosum]